MKWEKVNTVDVKSEASGESGKAADSEKTEEVELRSIMHGTGHIDVATG